MPIKEELLRIERELAGGDGSTYERHLHESALVVIPGETLDKPATVAAMDASVGWDEFSFGEETLLPLGEASALLNYRFRGRRGATRYEAFLSSAYVGDGEGEWKLVFHQQTPVPQAR